MEIENHQQQQKKILLDIPLELISHIVFRLPVKSICRFKCVSKTWLSLISSPNFIKAQLQFSSETIKNQNNPMILGFTQQSHRITFYTCSFSSLVTSNSLEEVKSIYLGRFDSRYGFNIVGSINGLYCICISDVLILWNPSIRKLKRLPQFVCGDISVVLFGFVYEDFNDDYKVVAFEGFYRKDKMIIRSYSLRENSWKIVRECDSPGFLTGQRSAYIGGNLHWVSPKDGGTLVGVSYNPKTEMLGEAKLPDFPRGSELSLSVVSGSLCAIQRFANSLHVWIMKEYGEPESWNKIAIFQLESSNGFSRYFYGLCRLEDGGILLNAVRGGIMKWNEKSGLFEYPNIEVEQGVVRFEEESEANRRFYRADNQKYVEIHLDQYFESLVSPIIDDIKKFD